MGEQFLPIRDPKEIQDFMETFYSEIGISPRDVEYVEACGSGKSSSLFVKSKSLVLTRSSQTQRNSSAPLKDTLNDNEFWALGIPSMNYKIYFLNIYLFLNIRIKISILKWLKFNLVNYICCLTSKQYNNLFPLHQIT